MSYISSSLCTWIVLVNVYPYFFPLLSLIPINSWFSFCCCCCPCLAMPAKFPSVCGWLSCFINLCMCVRVCILDLVGIYPAFIESVARPFLLPQTGCLIVSRTTVDLASLVKSVLRHICLYVCVSRTSGAYELQKSFLFFSHSRAVISTASSCRVSRRQRKKSQPRKTVGKEEISLYHRNVLQIFSLFFFHSS